MRLLYLVEQEYTVWRLADGIGQKSSILITHVSGWRTDEFCHGMLLGIFTHIEAYQFDAEFLGQLPCHLGFSYSGRSHEEERSQWFVIICQSRLCHHHSLNHLVYSLVLTVNLVEYALAERSQSIVILIFHRSRINLADFNQNLLDDSLGNIRALARFYRMHFQISTRLIHQVDGLVWQTAVADIFGAGTDGIFQGVLAIGYIVELVVFILQALQYLDSLLLGRFLDVYLLEPAHDALALSHVTVIFLVGGRADETDIACLQILLQHIGCIRSAI